METRNNIFREYLGEYLKANKQKKGKILKHVCFVAKMHKKSAVRKFKALQMRDKTKTDKRGRTEYYTADVTCALKYVWEAGNEVCGELLHPMIVEYVEIFKRDKMWKYGDIVTGKLLVMSLSTVKRRIGKFLKPKRRNGISATRPSQLKQIIPTFNGPWKELPPGHGQIDTVLHNNTLLGDAVYTLNYSDSATCLDVPRAQWNKGQRATIESMKAIKSKLPFPWILAHPDTGSEFINWHMKDWCEQNKIDFSRSRPGRKNDNMYVEERNGHVVRKMVGYINLTCIETVEALNEYYDVLTPYLMHFIAVRRMIGKERNGSKYQRVYEKKAKTPYLRILEHSGVSEENREKLRIEHEKLNPLTLKEEMEKRLKKVYDIQRQSGTLRA